MDFNFILDNLNAKLTGWKPNLLSMAGRVTLAKSSINNIPTHVMQYISLPSTILS